MEKINELTSENIVQQNIERLKEIFPTAFSEGKLVVDELQALLGDYIKKDKEFYQMTWAGKTQAQKEANKVSTGTLRPNKADSKNWDTTGNIFIEGDNLEVLKLLQKTYSNKIKMIYIDPPYNTGGEFVYSDDYKDNLNNYLGITGQINSEGKKFSTNTDSDGRYHSNWLNMMYPRLKLARNLMMDDGVIFISIDDNEQANLKKVCDEIFGEENFIDTIIWKKKYGGGAKEKYLVSVHEYVLVYARSIKDLPEILVEFDLEKAKKFYKNKDEHFEKLGYYRTHPLEAVKSFDIRENLNYPIEAPDGTLVHPKRQWRWSKETFDQNKDIVLFTKSKDGGWTVSTKQYLNDENGVQRKTKFQSLIDEIYTQEGTKEIVEIFKDAKIFSFPKPTSFLFKLLEVGGLKDNDYVLDFFSGSGTTQSTLFKFNNNFNLNVNCISVQLPEPTDEKSEAYKAGYKTIAEITKERIRRAGELIKQENKDKENIDKLDVGFRAFKLDSSNIQAWDTSIDKFEDQLDMFEENNGDSIKSDRTEEDVLFEILLKYGLDLTLPIQEKQIDGCTVYNIGFGSMYICLSNTIKVSVAKGISEWHKDSADKNPSVIFKDAGFGGDDSIKTNTVQTLRQAGIENVKSI